MSRRNRFVYSGSIKIDASGFKKLLESIFHAKCCQDVWISGSQLVRGQVNMADEAKLCSLIHSTFEALARHAVRCYHAEELSHFLLTHAGCRVCSFQFISLICWAYFSDVTVSLGFRKLKWVRLAADHQTVTMTLFGACLAFGSALELLGSTTEFVVAGCRIKSTFCHTSQSNPEWFIVATQNKRRWHFKIMIFLICGQFIRHPLIKLPICLKCQATKKWSTLSS